MMRRTETDREWITLLCREWITPLSNIVFLCSDLNATCSREPVVRGNTRNAYGAMKTQRSHTVCQPSTRTREVKREKRAARLHTRGRSSHCGCESQERQCEAQSATVAHTRSHTASNRDTDSETKRASQSLMTCDARLQSINQSVNHCQQINCVKLHTAS
jgi:hypothetical protein